MCCCLSLVPRPSSLTYRTGGREEEKEEEEEKKKKKFFFTDEEIILTGSVDKTVKAWLWLVDWSVAMAIHSYIYFRHHEKLTHKWTFEGHQLGVVSVTTDPSGEGIVNIP